MGSPARHTFGPSSLSLDWLLDLLAELHGGSQVKKNGRPSIWKGPGSYLSCGDAGGSVPHPCLSVFHFAHLRSSTAGNVPLSCFVLGFESWVPQRILLGFWHAKHTCDGVDSAELAKLIMACFSSRGSSLDSDQCTQVSNHRAVLKAERRGSHKLESLTKPFWPPALKNQSKSRRSALVSSAFVRY